MASGLPGLSPRDAGRTMRRGSRLWPPGALLLAASAEAAEERGFGAVRLFTPAGHGRTRRLYERERWTLHGGPVDDEGCGMQIVEFRRALR